jgi:hypothetical protein
MNDFTSKTLARELIEQSEQDAAAPPMDAVLDGAHGGQFSGDRCFRLLARLWTLKRMMYYIYGGWAQGINLNEYPPAVAYLFGKQTHDESTQEKASIRSTLTRSLRRIKNRSKKFSIFSSAPGRPSQAGPSAARDESMNNVAASYESRRRNLS